MELSWATVNSLNKIDSTINLSNMRKPVLLSLWCCLLINLSVWAQTPPAAFSYSAVARNSQGNPIANSNIGIQITITKTSPAGTPVYLENHLVSTDQFGLFNLAIGAGSVQGGNFGNIDWGVDNYYVTVGMDISGGNNFLTMGSTQLLSVPYALYAKQVSGGGNGGSFIHYIGESFGGGVVFHLWRDSQGIEHGLIVDKEDISVAQGWSNVNSILIGPAAQSSWDGSGNSNSITVQTGHTFSAALSCTNSTNGNQNDWYLPSIDELNLLWQNRFNVNKTLSQLSGANVIPLSANYWSSTEYSNNLAWCFFISTGNASNSDKSIGLRVRAIRAF